MRMRDKWWRVSEKEINRILDERYFSPLSEILKPREFANAKSYVLDAIRRGTLSWENGVFFGQLTSRISRELSRMGARYDARQNAYKLDRPPPEVLAAVVTAKTRTEEKAKEMIRIAEEAERQIEREEYDFPFGDVVEEMDRTSDEELRKIGVQAQLKPDATERLRRRYNESQTRNIRNWSKEQTERLRAAIEDAAKY